MNEAIVFLLFIIALNVSPEFARLTVYSVVILCCVVFVGIFCALGVPIYHLLMFLGATDKLATIFGYGWVIFALGSMAFYAIEDWLTLIPRSNSGIQPKHPDSLR